MQHAKRYKALLLDVDNTLLSFRPSSEAALRKAFQIHHLPYEDIYYEVFYWVGEVLWEQQRRERLSVDEIRTLIFPRLLSAIGIEADGNALSDTFHLQLHEEAVPEPGAVETIAKLSERYQLYVASNGVLEMQRSRLEIAGLANYFTDLFVSDDIGAEKPSERFFHEAMRRSKTEPGELLFVGDSIEADMIGAARSGIDRCWYNPQQLTAPARPKLNYTITALSELPRIL